MAVNLSPVGGVAAQFFTNTGAVLTGGKIYTYLAGTTTPAVTYTSSQGVTAWTNPIVLDAAGRVSGSGEIWLTDGIIYKFVLKDSNDVLIATYDNITGINSNSVAYTNQQEIVTATAGQTVFNLGISYQPGTNSLSVFVDGVNQYGPGASYAYTETDSDTVTFVSGLHVGAEVKFTTTQQQGAGAVDASQVTYDPPFTDSVATNVENKLAEFVSVADFGAVGDGTTDDSSAVQAAIDYLESVGGGKLLVQGTCLVGGLTIDAEYITITGDTEADQLIIKNSTTGVTVSQNFVDFENITIISQGTKSDGLGTNGVVYVKTPVNSVGFCHFSNVNIKNFSGNGLLFRDSINFVYQSGYVQNNHYGVTFDRDVSASSFGTTVSMDDVYFSSCDIGVVGNFLYQSRFSIIAEACTYGMYMNVGSFTLYRCYFEGNTSLGCFAQNCSVQDLLSYNNDPVTDAVSITFTGATAAADRGSIVMDDVNFLAKTVGIESQYGVDPLYFASYGTTSNNGLKWGANTVALVRGTNLLNNASWTGNTVATTDLIGWDNLNQGFKVAGTVGGGGTSDPYGMTQNVTLNNTKTYVIDLHVTNVAGSGIASIKVGNDVITSGVAFTPTANGSQAVKCFGADTTGTVYESYVNSFTLAEVLADVNQIAESNDRLTRQKTGRGVSYAAAAPTTGRWMLGEIVYNTAPTSGGYVGWVCTASGSPGTWKTFGLIS